MKSFDPAVMNQACIEVMKPFHDAEAVAQKWDEFCEELSEVREFQRHVRSGAGATREQIKNGGSLEHPIHSALSLGIHDRHEVSPAQGGGMQDSLWNARLNPSSPRYLTWRKIFDHDDNIPIHSPIPVKAKLDGEPEEIYLLDLVRMDELECENLIEFVVNAFKTQRADVAAELDRVGYFPVRREDLIVAIDLSAFV